MIRFAARLAALLGIVALAGCTALARPGDASRAGAADARLDRDLVGRSLVEESEAIAQAAGE